MQTKFTLLFLLATWVSNAQYQIFFKDQFLVTTNEIKQDSLGVHYRQGGVEKIVAYKDLYAIKGEEESFFFRGRYARRTRQYQPNFYDLSKDFSVGVNMLSALLGHLELNGTYFLDASKEFELNITAAFAVLDQKTNIYNRKFKDNFGLDFRKYITLKRRSRFAYGLGASIGNHSFDYQNKSHYAHPEFALSQIEELEKKEDKSSYEEWQLENLKRNYHSLIKNAKNTRTYSVYSLSQFRTMLDPRFSLNLGLEFGFEWSRFLSGYHPPSNYHLYDYTDFYFLLRIGVNYHFNFK